MARAPERRAFAERMRAAMRRGASCAARMPGWLAMALLLAGVVGVRADNPRSSSSSSSSSSAKPVDDTDVIEFLGGVGSEDEDLLNYLARTDPTKVARAPQSPPASSGGKQNE
jgi:hypothetical protein